jgi:hypothetical protein
MTPMRRGFYWVLVVVLVLRGLAGTAMAAGVLSPFQPMGLQHLQGHSPQQTSPGTAAHDHGMHEAEPQHHSAGIAHGDHFAPVNAAETPCHEGPADPAAHDHHSMACSACEICHSAMLDVTSVTLPTCLSAGLTQPAECEQFDSAPAALAIKPPIA